MTQTASVTREPETDVRTIVPAPAAGAALIAAGAVAVAFLTKTGSGPTGTGLAQNTWVQIVLVVLGVAAAAALAVRGASGPAHGRTTFALFGAVAVLTAVSIAWSVAPDQSWIEAARTASYLAAFGIALVCARLVPSQWRVLPTAIALASVALSAWAVFAKAISSGLYDEWFGRLQAPFTYWNATGLAAAIGLPVLVWLGSRRDRSPVARALAVPGIVLLITVVVLSASRSAVAAAIVGTALPLAFGRTRLRSVLTVALGAVGGGIVCAWALHNHNLTDDAIPTAARVSASHEFGIVVAVVLILSGVVAAVVGARVDRTRLPEDTRRRIGTVLWALVALVPVIAVLGLAASSRGLTGEVSHLWSRLTSTNGGVSDSASRLAALSSSRPDYWHQAMAVGNHHLIAGAGAGGFGVAHWRFPTAKLATASHAHSYVLQTYADFGLIGIALNLALLIAWIRSAGVTLEWWPRSGRDRPRSRAYAASGSPPGAAIHSGTIRSAGPRPAALHPGERDSVWALLGVVGAFAVSSAIDWTWFAPGVALPALASAGWIAGRGPLSRQVGIRGESWRTLGTRPGAILAITAVLAVGIGVVWETWQPLRSQNALNAGIAAHEAGDTTTALADFRTAVNAFPLSLTAIQYLGNAYASLGSPKAARRWLVHGTVVQPQNPCSWMYLGQYEWALGNHDEGAAALARAGELNIAVRPFTPTTTSCI